MAASSRKGKAPEQLSTNPHTTKARNRKAGLPAVQRDIENAIAADHMACRRAIDKVKSSTEYVGKSEGEKQEMEEAAVHNMMDKR